jgi:hypothetical protein
MHIKENNMKKIITLLMMFFGSFLSASEKLLPNGIAPDTHDINTTVGLILFFLWPAIIIVSYICVEFTLKKTGIETDL